MRAPASTLVNAELGLGVGRRGRLALEVFNVLDARVSDIEYSHRSRLSGEPASGLDDVHTHPQAPRTARLLLTIAIPGGTRDADLPPQRGHTHGGRH